jgi:hypothetical protein
MTLLTNIAVKATGWGTSALGFLGSIKTVLIVSAVVAAASFGAGWYSGSTHEAKIMASAATQAADKARAAQAKKDAGDWASAKADYEKRLKAKTAGDAQYQVIYRDRKITVPNPTHATVSVAAMHSLNDPALVGDTQ